MNRLMRCGASGRLAAMGAREVSEDWRGNTYRCVYTVKVAGVVYVLHVFQKKPTSGIATPQHDMNLIRERLKQALAKSKE